MKEEAAEQDDGDGDGGGGGDGGAATAEGGGGEDGDCDSDDHASASSSVRRPKNSPASSNFYESCHVCGRVTNNRSGYEIHMRTHTRELPFVCGVCGKGFSQSNNMYRHSRTVHGVEPNLPK